MCVRRGRGTVRERHISVTSPTSLIVGSVSSTDTRNNIFICLQLYKINIGDLFIPINYASVQIYLVANFIFGFVASFTCCHFFFLWTIIRYVLSMLSTLDYSFCLEYSLILSSSYFSLKEMYQSQTEIIML